jgi:CheY-like chemotaxis protein
MPICSGLAIVEVLRKAHWPVPVILMTAFGDEETKTHAAELGAVLLHKPFAIADLRGRPLLVSEDLARACNLQFGNVERAPKFDFDKTELTSEDRSVLQQIATCVTTGPLRGRTLKLVGRADPRGEVEYNMGLGERRNPDRTPEKGAPSTLGAVANSNGCVRERAAPAHRALEKLGISPARLPLRSSSRRDVGDIVGRPTVQG